MSPIKQNTVGIIGAGWLGLPLALALNDYCNVWCTTSRVSRQSQIHTLGLNATQWHYQKHSVSALSSFMANSDTLVITLPFKRGGNVQEYLNVIEELAIKSNESGIQHLIFLSSMSVYKAGNFALTNTTAVDETHGLVQAEKLLLSHVKHATILRLSGLIGPADLLADTNNKRDRHPVYFLSGKTKHDGSNPINLIHQQSIIEAISKLIQTPSPGVFNLNQEDDRNKAEYYNELCQEKGLDAVIYDSTHGQEKRKVISNFNAQNGLISD
jgi:nucleoside-diphosphate-sugar epimerase